jgi:type IV pilus assembly protein PilX
MKYMKTYLPTYTHFNGQPHGQQGAVLIIALMLLIVLTMLGISAIESTKLETKMAANTTNYNRAFQVAEAGLTKALDNYLVGTAKDAEEAFEDITEQQQCDDNSEALSTGDSQAIRCVEKSRTEKQIDTDNKQLFYIVESTGHSHANNNNSLQTKIVAGISIEGPEGTTLFTK